MTTRVTGGEKLRKHLAEQRRKIADMPKGVEVGFYGDVAAKAVANEFGVPEHDIPERPFFRQAIATALPKLRKRALELASRDGVITERGALELGQILADELRTTIENFTTPPNKPWKGRSDPLQFTNELVKAIKIKLIK